MRAAIIISVLEWSAAGFGLVSAFFWWKSSRVTFRAASERPPHGFATPITDVDLDRFNALVVAHNARGALSSGLMAACLALSVLVQAIFGVDSQG